MPTHNYCVPLLAILVQQHRKVRPDKTIINTPERQALLKLQFNENDFGRHRVFCDENAWTEYAVGGKPRRLFAKSNLSYKVLIQMMD